jgi:hypothetical protein
LVWRKRRYRCSDCARTFTETHEQLPARQRVTGRFRAHLGERVADGAAHAEVAREERTTRYQVACAFADCVLRREAAMATIGRGGCRSMRPITAAVTTWPRWSLTWTAAA